MGSGFSVYGVYKLDHLHPFKALLFWKFSTLFPFHTGRPILVTPEGQYWEKGIHPTPKLNDTEGFQCLRHSNWTISSPWSPFCFRKFSTFSLSYWGPILITPEG